VYEDGTFDICPLDPAAKCTAVSVAAHTLYEKSRPDVLHGPGGFLDLRKTTYHALENGPKIVSVDGAIFQCDGVGHSPWTVKLEGAVVTGYRTLFMGSFHDPILIEQLNDYLEQGKKRVEKEFANSKGRWQLEFHTYGLSSPSPKEVFVVGEVLADSQQLATSIASGARVYCAHGSYKGQLATGGSFAFGLGGMMELEVGECCEFSVYHLMTLNNGESGGQILTDDDDLVVPKSKAADGLFTWQSVSIPRSSHQPNGISHIAEPAKTIPSKAVASKKAPNGILDSPRKELRTLRDIAKVIRSKNAGPYELTYDVMFDDMELYQAVKESGLLSAEVMASLFERSIDDIEWCGFFDQALAFKATLPRRRGGKLACSGGFMENDVHGSQQYVPLMGLELSEGLIQKIEAIWSSRSRME
jgi:hypothetical protein